MKAKIYTFFVILLTLFIYNLSLAVSQASPDWHTNFVDTYQYEGLQRAVNASLAQGVSASELIKYTLKLQWILPFDAIKAVVIAGGSQDDVVESALQAGVSSIITLKAIAEANEVRAGDKPHRASSPLPKLPEQIDTVEAGFPWGAAGFPGGETVGGYISPSGF